MFMKLFIKKPKYFYVIRMFKEKCKETIKSFTSLQNKLLNFEDGPRLITNITTKNLVLKPGIEWHPYKLTRFCRKRCAFREITYTLMYPNVQISLDACEHNAYRTHNAIYMLCFYLWNIQW